jgi:phage gp46-like protein
MEWQGDIWLNENKNGIGGDIEVSNGQPKMDTGLETAIYISLFSNNWWGNELADENAEVLDEGLDIYADEKMTNQTRLLIINRTKNLLKWILDTDLADEIEVEASLNLDIINIKIAINKKDIITNFKYKINWKNQTK